MTDKPYNDSDQGGPMSNDLPKIERLLRCMMMLIENEEHSRYSIEQMAQRLGTSPRTIYRYIKTLTKVGFVIPRPVRGVFHISKDSQALSYISKAIYFSDEERLILATTLSDMADNRQTQRLREKLERTYRQAVVADIMQQPRLSDNITTLQAAIDCHLQATLHNYRSGHSDTMTDRIVEPFEISSDADYLIAYEPHSGQNKTFKIARIGSVSIGTLEWQFADRHKHLATDIFRFAGEPTLPLKLVLNSYAADLLTREYPLAQPHITPLADGNYLLETQVCQYTAAARFVLGLMDQVEIVDCQPFINFIAQKVAQSSKIVRRWQQKQS